VSKMSRFLVVGAVAALVLTTGCGGSSRTNHDTGDVTGFTVEETTFAPVAGAAIAVGGKSATSGADGSFTVTGVPKGDQKLTVDATGYLAFSTTVTVASGSNDVGQLWLKRSQQDGGQTDGGQEDGGQTDGPPPDGEQQDAAPSDGQHDANPTDVLQTDVLQTDVLQTDVLQTDVAQTDVAQSDVIQTDVIQSDHIQTDVLQTDVMVQQDTAVARSCGTLQLTANPIWPGTPVDSATFSGASLTAPHATTPCTAGGAGPEHVFWFHNDHVADLVWEVTQSNWNVVAYVRQDCDGLDGGGNAIADPVCADVAGASMETAVWPAAPAGDYYFFVDGATAGDVGAYQARLTVREIHGAGQSCDGITARCQDGLTCQQGTCWTVVNWCDTSAAGTLQLGVAASGTTVGGANTLQCSVGFGLSNDVHYVFTAESTGGTYSVHATSADHPLYIYNAPASTCLDPAVTTNCTGDGFSQDVNFDLVLTGSQKTYVIVDSPNGTSGAYTVQIDKVQFHGAGGACGDRLNRCSAGLTCQGGLCYDIITWCTSLTDGTLVESTPVGGTTVGSTSHLTCSDGQGQGLDDLWRLTAGSAGTFVVIGASTDHDLVLYSTPDCTSSTLSQNCPAGAARALNFDLTLQAGQTVYVVVDGAAGAQGAYTLVYHKVQFRSLGQACDPAQPLTIRCATGLYCDQTSHCAAVQDEVESNDTFATANAATSGRPIRGTKSTATDVDWFSISANAGDLIIAETTDGATDRCAASGGLDSRLRIFGTDGATLLALDDDISASDNWCSFAAARVAAAGTYYVALDYFGGGSGTFDYTLRIWARAPSVYTEVEANDTTATANGVTNVSWIGGVIASASDYDYFVFTAPAGQRIIANVPVTVATCPHQDLLAVLASDGATVLASTTSGCDVAISPIVPAAGTHYVRINSAAAFSYSLVVVTLPP
jgi:hypothetical protein